MTERLDLQGRHLVLGLSGGIACYKAADLARELVKAGATVQVVMTEAAGRFITPVTMQALTGRPVFTDQWDSRPTANMAHIDLSREADALIVARPVPISSPSWRRAARRSCCRCCAWPAHASAARCCWPRP